MLTLIGATMVSAWILRRLRLVVNRFRKMYSQSRRGHRSHLAEIRSFRCRRYASFPPISSFHWLVSLLRKPLAAAHLQSTRLILCWSSSPQNDCALQGLLLTFLLSNKTLSFSNPSDEMFDLFPFGSLSSIFRPSQAIWRNFSLYIYIYGCLYLKVIYLTSAHKE